MKFWEKVFTWCFGINKEEYERGRIYGEYYEKKRLEELK